MPQPIEINTPLVIWRIIDGKPGHENQTLGLANAMRRIAEQRQRECVVVDISAHRQQAGPIAFLRRHFPAGEGLPAPDFILAAGSGTHWSLLCAQRRYGGKSVVLMKPSLPLSWFDWVVVPEHDGVSGKNVITTKGVLNPMRPSEKVPGSVLVLVGGESKHFEWDNDHVLKCVLDIRSKHTNLLLTDSRRTPSELRAKLLRVFDGHYLAWEKFNSSTLVEKLSKTETVYVTEDSVSMIYESLTAGCVVHTIEPNKSKKKGRLSRGLSELSERNLINSDHHKVCDFNESDRVANSLIHSLMST